MMDLTGTFAFLKNILKLDILNVNVIFNKFFHIRKRKHARPALVQRYRNYNFCSVLYLIPP